MPLDSEQGTFFAEDLDALSALTHMEIAVEGVLQLRFYDHLAVALAGPSLERVWLQRLVAQETIRDPQAPI